MKGKMSEGYIEELSSSSYKEKENLGVTLQHAYHEKNQLCF